MLNCSQLQLFINIADDYALLNLYVLSFCSLTRKTRSLLQNFGSSVIHKVEFRENFAVVGQKGLTRGTAIEQVYLQQLLLINFILCI